MNFTPEFAMKSRQEALRKYEDERQKFGLQMMMMSYYKIKSLLTEEGLRKVVEIDAKRESDTEFNKYFSEKMWKSTEDAWGQALGQLMIKIADSYGLQIGKDISTESNNDPLHNK